MRKNTLHTKNLWILVFLICISANSIYAELRSSISQYGITWTFDGQYECGQFVTGDWWVVGPVTINSVSPAPTVSPVRNGSSVNPQPGYQGYDDRRNPFNTANNVSYPCTLQPEQSLVSSISKPNDYPNEDIDGLGTLNDQAILTVVSAPVATGTFRPGYCGTYKSYFNISQVDLSAIPNVAPPSSAPAASTIIAMSDRPRVDHISSANINNTCAENNWNNGGGLSCYGRNYSSAVSEVGMFAMLNTPEKTEVVYNIIQWGIDNYSVLKAGGLWLGDGGHHSGRKFPIVFAAVLLNDPDMLLVGTEFSQKTGEDHQTYYGVYKALFGKEAYMPWYFCTGDGAKDQRDPDGLLDACGYRVCCTSHTWVGQMLAILMINGQNAWGHDAFFDYVDRWMIGDVEDGGNTSSAFIADMWNLYRNNLPGTGDPVPVTGVSVSPSTLTLEPGLSSNLSYTIDPTDATNKMVTWSSDNTSIATVDASGYVTAISEGIVSVTVTTVDGDFASTCVITVVPPSGDYNLAIGKLVTTTSYDGTTVGDNIVDGNVNDDSRWSAIGYPQSATIDLGEECNISRLELYTYQSRAYQYGIEVSSDGTNFTQIVDRSSNVTTNQPITDMVSSTGRYIKLTVTGADGYTGTWISINELLVIGSLTGTSIPVTGVTVSPTSVDIDEGETAQLTEIVLPVDATNKTVTWTSNNTAIATVDANGLVTGVAEGSCQITVTTNSGGFSANCPVTVTAIPNPVAGVYFCDPVNGSMSNNGSESSPWGSLEDVINVGTTFATDDMIYLMNGNHGNPVINYDNPGNVTITKYAGHNPEISRLVIDGADNWTIDDVKITSNGQIIANQNIPLEHPVYPLTDNSLLVIQSSNNITIDNCMICSVDDNSVWTTTDDWNYYAWNGITTGGGSNLKIINNYIKNVNFGSNGGTDNGFIYRNNVVENFCGDGMQIGCTYAIIENNVFMNCYKVNGNHCDMIQGMRSTPGYGLQIRGNKLLNYTDPNQSFIGSCQGMGFFDRMKNDYIIENNLVVVDHWHGITLLGATNCQIINNTVADPNNTGIGPAWIQIAADLEGPLSTGNIIRNNLCTNLNNDANIGTVDNNIVVGWSEYSTYFVDYANSDYHTKAGSPAIDAGISTGAPSVDLDGIARPQGAGYDVGAYEYSGAIVSVTGVTLTPQTLSLEMSQTVNLVAEIEPVNATNQSIIWNSSNPSVATINNGTVTALTQGTATITVTTNDGGYIANCAVTVNSTGSLPSPWANSDIGAVAATGSATYSGGTFTIEGSGADIWSIADEFHFIYQTLNGDGEIVARLASIENTNSWAKAGVMIRETLNSNSKHSSTVVTPGNGFNFQRRVTTGGVSSNTGASGSAPQFIKISRNGDVFTSSYSPDGSSWTQIGTDVISMASSVYIGMAITSHNDGTLCTGVFDNVSVNGSSIVPVTSVSVTPTSLTLNVGQTSDLTETVSPANATDQSVTWSSSNASVATVDANGLVTAISAGNATITVTTNDGGFTANSAITVNVPVISVTGVSVSPTTLTIDEGQSSDLAETVSPANATNQSVSWSSSNTSVATVDANGLVTAIAEGSAIITVTTNDGGYTANCNVTVNSTGALPSPWVNSDIGAVAASGSAAYSGGTFTVEGSGSNIWNTVDEFHYVYQQISGDATITARIASLEQIHQWTKGGIMMRESLNANSINGNVFIAPVATNGSKFSYRSTSGATSSEFDGPNVTAPYWLRLERSGNTFTGSVSVDGTNWTTLGSATLNMSATYYIGLSVVSLVDGTLATAVFDNVMVQSTTSIPVTGVNVSPASLTLDEGLSSALTVTVGPVDATDQSVTWSSSNTAVATVDANGVVSALSGGQASITVTTNDGGYTANCAVTVNVPVISVTGVSVSPTTLTLDEGQSSDLAETVSPANATNQSVSWSSSNTSVATVNTNGLVTAISAGNATITVTTTDGGYTANCAVTVNTPAPAEWVTLTYDDFESGWGNYYTTSSGDCGLYTGSYAHQGAYAVRTEDNSGDNSAFWYANSIDVTSFTDIKIEFWYIGVSMESGESFEVQYWDGSSWITVATRVSGVDLNGAFTFEEINLSSASHVFTTDFKVRFECVGSSNGDLVYFDEIKVSAYDDPLKSLQKENDINVALEPSINIYPNPADDGNFYVQLSGMDNESETTIEIIDISGKKVYSKIINPVEPLIKVNSSSIFGKGLYIVKISNAELLKIQKVVVK